MKIRRSRPTVGWTQIPNVVARDYRLSWRARGLLLELLSYPPGWETTIDELVKRAQRQAAEVGGTVEGRDAMRAAARELKAAGYLVVTKHQDARGRWRTDVEVTDAPMWDLLSGTTDDGISVVGATSTEHDVSAGRTDDGIPAVGSPAVGSSGVPKKKETKKETPPPRAQRETAEAEEPIQEEQEGTAAAENADQDGAALSVVDAATALWGGHRLPTPSERLRLAERAAEALSKGARRADVVHALSRDLSGARSAVAVVMARTAAADWWRVEIAPATATAPKVPLPEWCGQCDGPEANQRFIVLDDGRVARCPRCHPREVGPSAAA